MADRPIIPCAVVAIGGAAHGHFYDSESGKRITMSVPYFSAVELDKYDPDVRGRVTEQLCRADRYRLEPVDWAFGPLRLSGWIYRWDKTPMDRAATLAMGLLLASAMAGTGGKA